MADDKAGGATPELLYTSEWARCQARSEQMLCRHLQNEHTYISMLNLLRDVTCVLIRGALEVSYNGAMAGVHGKKPATAPTLRHT